MDDFEEISPGHFRVTAEKENAAAIVREGIDIETLQFQVAAEALLSQLPQSQEKS